MNFEQLLQACEHAHNYLQGTAVYAEISQVLSDYTLSGSIWQSVTAKSHKELKNKCFKGVDTSMLLSRLSFTHILELIWEKDQTKRAFYEVEAIKGNWSVRQLKRQINSLLYERTGLSTDKKALILDTNKKAEPSTPKGYHA